MSFQDSWFRHPSWVWLRESSHFLSTLWLNKIIANVWAALKLTAHSTSSPLIYNSAWSVFLLFPKLIIIYLFFVMKYKSFTENHSISIWTFCLYSASLDINATILSHANVLKALVLWEAVRSDVWENKEVDLGTPYIYTFLFSFSQWV